MDREAVQLNLELYKKVYLIRAAEYKICEHYHEDEMKTPVHLSVGEEAIAAGVCHAIVPEHYVLGTYRSHGIYLAVTGETDKFFAELYENSAVFCFHVLLDRASVHDLYNLEADPVSKAAELIKLIMVQELDFKIFDNQ